MTRKSTILAVIVAAFAVACIGVFIWPTPYEYTRKAPNVWRVNRFTGVTEVSSGSGWMSEADWQKQVDAERAKEMDAVVNEKVESLLEESDLTAAELIYIREGAKHYPSDLRLDYVSLQIELVPFYREHPEERP